MKSWVVTLCVLFAWASLALASLAQVSEGTQQRQSPALKASDQEQPGRPDLKLLLAWLQLGLEVGRAIQSGNAFDSPFERPSVSKCI